MNQDKTINSKAKKLGLLLKRGKLSLSCAESATGGLLSHAITNNAGSSDYFPLGIVTYSNQAKIKLLNVPGKIIEKYGAVSRQCARQMAKGIKKKIDSDIALSITAIAGPSSPSSEKPVGLAYISICGIDGKTQTTEENFKGSRLKIKHKIVNKALSMLISYLENAEK
jgi:PncC family amidohydrolase